MAKLRMCGIWVTSRMVYATLVTSILCLLGSLSLFFLFTTSTCFDDYDWHDYSCSRYTTNLFITGSFLLLTGATILVGGVVMSFKLRNSTKEELASGSMNFSVHTSHPYEKMPQEKPPSFYS
ncbi:uncharacterized protein [Palaemon carinicauda]|uniref:uncharacterized protein n=1 Tax=Palaemon carinicauda TaxID=392227 RepID=UPI0035B585D0